MKIVYNKIIPFAGYQAITLWPFIFVRTKNVTDILLNHENIHGRQQVEVLAVAVVLSVLLWLIGCSWWSLLALPLYLWLYVGLWLYMGFRKGWNKAYKANPLEREAYYYENAKWYLSERKPFAWLNFF